MTKKTMGRKMLALLLTAVMLIGIVPVALAETSTLIVQYVDQNGTEIREADNITVQVGDGFYGMNWNDPTYYGQYHMDLPGCSNPTPSSYYIQKGELPADGSYTLTIKFDRSLSATLIVKHVDISTGEEILTAETYPVTLNNSLGIGPDAYKKSPEGYTYDSPSSWWLNQEDFTAGGSTTLTLYYKAADNSGDNNNSNNNNNNNVIITTDRRPEPRTR